MVVVFKDNTFIVPITGQQKQYYKRNGVSRLYKGGQDMEQTSRTAKDYIIEILDRLPAEDVEYILGYLSVMYPAS